MPQIFAPYVRLELLFWDPLVTPTFENQQWYQELFNYGIIGVTASFCGSNVFF